MAGLPFCPSRNTARPWGQSTRRGPGPFAASCESASSLAEFVRLDRKARTKWAIKVEHSEAAAHSVFDQLRFLEMPILDLAISALAGVGMITVNGTGGQPADAPYAEMHSLVGKWLVNTDHQILINLDWSTAFSNRARQLGEEVEPTHLGLSWLHSYFF